MKSLVIDIFNKYIDFSHDFEETITHRYGNVFIINDDNIDIGEYIHHMVMSNKGDGVQTMIRNFKNVTYMKIYLLLSEKEEDVDISYLINYLESIYEITNDDLININYDNYDSLININYGESKDNVNLDEIISEFRNAGLEYEICTEGVNIYERGASGIAGQIIIGICGGVGSGATLLCVQAVLNKLKQKSEQRNFVLDYITFGNFNKNKLLLNLAKEIGNPDINKYQISNFAETKDGNFSVIIEKRDVKHDIICNKDAQILRKRTTYFI